MDILADQGTATPGIASTFKEEEFKNRLTRCPNFLREYVAYCMEHRSYRTTIDPKTHLSRAIAKGFERKVKTQFVHPPLGGSVLKMCERAAAPVMYVLYRYS